MKKSKRTALLELLLDPDEEVYASVYQELKHSGEDIIPDIEQLMEFSNDYKFQAKLENLLNDIRTVTFENNLLEWKKSSKKSLIEATFLISKYQYSELIISDLETLIELIIQDIWLEMNEYLTGFEKVKIINKIIFDYYQFNITESHAPHYNYINYLLETKKGHTIIFSIFYLIICNRLDLPIYAVQIPDNLILAYMDEYFSESKVLFYINPNKRGAFLSKKEIEYFLNQYKIKDDPSYYLPINNVDIIKQYIRSIVLSLEKVGKNDRARIFNNLYQQLNKTTKG